MATYYVRKSGNDSNAGTSAGAAWATIGKALGASGIASGDTLYIGPGDYREVVTVAMTSPVAETFITGDPTGQYTGDTPGPVYWTAYTAGPYSTWNSGNCCTLAGRGYLTFSSIWFHGTVGISGTSNNITSRKCMFSGGMGAASRGLDLTSTYAQALAMLVEDCVFLGCSRGVGVTATRGGAGDYDLASTVRRCLFVGSHDGGIYLGATGAGANYGNGIAITQCTGVGTTGPLVATANTELSTTYPITIKNSISFHGTNGGQFASGFAAGQITDSGGNLSGRGLNNVTAHASSRYLNSANIIELPLTMGLERQLWGIDSTAPFSMRLGYALIGHE